MNPPTTPEEGAPQGRGARWAALPPNLKGAAFITLAAFFFVVMTMLIRLVSPEISVVQILFIRQIVMLAGVLPMIIGGFPASLRTFNPGLHAARVMAALGAMMLGFTAVRNLPLADVTALSFAKSFFLTIFAILFLKEVVGVRRWSATIVGFVGVLIVLRPTGDSVDIYGLMAVVSAACAGLVMILIRILARTDRPLTILTYQATFVGALIAPFAVASWVTPGLVDLAIIIAIGLVSIVAQSLNIQAFKAGEATFLAALDYSRLLWAVLLGFVVFREIPAYATFIGSAVVIGAALYTVHREAKRGRQLSRSAGGRSFSST